MDRFLNVVADGLDDRTGSGRAVLQLDGARDREVSTGRRILAAQRRRADKCTINIKSKDGGETM